MILYLARDKKTQHLNLFFNEPTCDADGIWRDNGNVLHIPVTNNKNIFPEVTFETSPCRMVLCTETDFDEIYKN